jgi:hypothetical protein
MKLRATKDDRDTNAMRIERTWRSVVLVGALVLVAGCGGISQAQVTATASVRTSETAVVVGHARATAIAGAVRATEAADMRATQMAAKVRATQAPRSTPTLVPTPLPTSPPVPTQPPTRTPAARQLLDVICTGQLCDDEEMAGQDTTQPFQTGTALVIHCTDDCPSRSSLDNDLTIYSNDGAPDYVDPSVISLPRKVPSQGAVREHTRGGHELTIVSGCYWHVWVTFTMNGHIGAASPPSFDQANDA